MEDNGTVLLSYPKHRRINLLYSSLRIILHFISRFVGDAEPYNVFRMDCRQTEPSLCKGGWHAYACREDCHPERSRRILKIPQPIRQDNRTVPLCLFFLLHVYLPAIKYTKHLTITSSYYNFRSSGMKWFRFL